MKTLLLAAGVLLGLATSADAGILNKNDVIQLTHPSVGCHKPAAIDDASQRDADARCFTVPNDWQLKVVSGHELTKQYPAMDGQYACFIRKDGLNVSPPGTPAMTPEEITKFEANNCFWLHIW